MNYYMTVDIESGGLDKSNGIYKPVFALGAIVYSIDVGGNTLEEEGLSLSWPVDISGEDGFNRQNFDEETWKTFWGPDAKQYGKEVGANFVVLKQLIAAANCKDEEDLIGKFYSWWMGIMTNERYSGNIKIVTDCPNFDIGVLDLLIAKYRPAGDKSLPLLYQWNSAGKCNYSSIIDYNTFELLFEHTLAEPYKVMGNIIGPNKPNHDHDPLNDARAQAYSFAKIYCCMQELLVKKFE